MSNKIFRKGQWVEVTSDEEGFQGAWFLAKIIRLPLESNDALSASKTKMKRKDEFLVEYESIMEDEEGTKRLREYAHTSCTRPVPPKEPVRVFEVNEWVDAYDRDGWWKGVITEVLEEELKYVVYFKSTKEKLEFVQSDLRVHLDCIDGIWVKPSRLKQQQQLQKEIKQNNAERSKKDVKKRGRPPKEKSTTEQEKVVYDLTETSNSTETEGQSTQNYKRRRNVTKDKVKDKGSGLKSCSEQASSDASMWSTEVLRDIADKFQSPPVTDNKEAASRKNSPVVTPGVLITTADEYQSPMIIDNNKGILRDAADERQSSPMIDNKGISPDGMLVFKSNDAAIEEDPSVRTEILRDTVDEHQSSSMVDNKATEEEDPSGSSEVLIDTADEHQSSPMIDNQNDTLVSNNIATEEDPSVSAEVLRDTTEEHQSSPMINIKRISPDGTLVSKSNNTATEEDPSVRSEIFRDTADEHQSSPMMNTKEISLDKVSKSNVMATKEDTLLKDREIPESLNLIISLQEDTCMGKQCNDAIMQQNEIGSVSDDNQCNKSREVEKEVTLMSVYKHCDTATAIQNQMKESSLEHKTRKEYDKAHLEAPVIASTKDKASLENQSLPFVKAPLMGKRILEAPVIASTINKVTVENESLPFVKTPLMWERILALEIFEKMPQRPHFRPLKQYNMAHREGMAIGHMITFANVVEKARASQIEDPRSNLEDMSIALVDLEAHGFNIQAIQSVVQRSLQMKDKQLMLEKKTKEAQVKMTVLKNENDKFKAQLNKVKENLQFHEEATIRFRKEYEVLMKEVEKIGSDTSVCQMELDATVEDSNSVKLEYPNVFLQVFGD